MPFKMIASRPLYRPDEGREYQKGQPFTVETEAEVKRLTKSKRARVDDTKPVAAKPPQRRPEPMVTKVVTAEESVTGTPPAVAPQSETGVRPGRYRRSDLRSED